MSENDTPDIDWRCNDCNECPARFHQRIHAYTRDLTRGTLAIVMRLSRVLGIAPYVLDAGRARVSRPLTYYGRILNIIICTIYLTRTIIDMVIYRVGSSLLSNLIWIIYACSLVTINILGACSAPRRFRCLVHCMQSLDQTHISADKKLLNATQRRIDRISKRYVVLNIAILVIYTIIHQIFDDAVTNNKFLRVFDFVGKLLIDLILHMVPLLLIFEFTFLTLKVLMQLLKVNACFERILEELSKPAGDATYLCLNMHIELRHLALAYASACEVVRMSTEGNEVTMIAILISTVAHLETLSFVVFAKSYTFSLPGAVIIAYMTIVNIIYITNVIILVESCHRVHKQMNKTNESVSHVMYYSDLPEKVCNELQRFKMLLQLNQPTYSPLGLCTLARPLLLKIIGATISYLVIILQFEYQ